MAASASSLALSSFNPKSLPFCVSRPASVSLLPPSLSFKLNSDSISVSIAAKLSSPASRFVRNVAVSSDFEVEEDGVFADDAAPQEQSFSADLKLFVGNLPFNVDSAQLAQLFESAGNVEMVEVIYDKVTGRSRGFGFVTMSSASSLALSSFNPKSLPFCVSRPASISLLPPSLSFKLNSDSISVSIAAKLSSPASRFVRNVAVSSDFEVEEDGVFADDAAPQEQSFSADLKLFVGNLPFNVDSAQLAQLFESAGNVEMVEVIYDKVTGRSRGFGFVTMSSVSEVEAAAQQFNGYELDGRPLRVNAGPPPPKREDGFSRGPRSSFGSSGSGYGGGGSGAGSGNRVYVGNLSWGVDDMALESLFGEQGKVVEARVIYDRDSGRSKGFGFVTYNSAQEVQNAIRSLNGADLDGRQIRVSEAEARPPRRQF